MCLLFYLLFIHTEELAEENYNSWKYVFPQKCKLGKMAIINRHFLLANQLPIDGSIEDKSACSHLFQSKSMLGLGLKNQYGCWEFNLDVQHEQCSLLTTEPSLRAPD